MSLLPLEIARGYLRRHWMPLPVPYKSKNPNFKGWQNFKISESELDNHFNGRPQNIGVLLGNPSGGLVDIDLNCAEAITLAPMFLPPTDAIFGRASNPRSHRLYYATLSTRKYSDPLLERHKEEGERKKAMLVEIRSTGTQTLFPGSVHPTGEDVRWVSNSDPATVDADGLARAVETLAAAVLLARYWPQGRRNDAANALAGGLLRAGWPSDTAIVFIEAICQAAQDEETQARIRNVVGTAAKLEVGAHVNGWPTLSKIIDSRIVSQVCEWLRIKEFAGGTVDSNKSETDETPRKTSQATKLMRLAQDIELFHTAEGHSFATVPVANHKETLNLRSSIFRDWLAREFWQRESSMPSSQALQDAIHGLSGRARFDNQLAEVHLRIAQTKDAIYLDLCDETWRAACITANGWTVTDEVPVKFRRTRGMLALPEPKRGGSISDLRRFINVAEESWPLVIAWLIAAFRPHKPFPVLALHGEQGSAKSTTARLLRSLIDPNKAALRSEPRDGRDLIIGANNGWLIALDNLSRVPTWLSDALCRLATGGGFSTRELYSDSEEILFEATRPILINGIEELATRSDLLDRTLLVSLPTIPESNRRTESDLWREFENVRPAILGSLLDAVSTALRNVEHTHLEQLPRMADFALWGVAAEASLGLEVGAFLSTYQGNREASNDLALEVSTVGTVLQSFMEGRQRWSGTATDLLTELNAITTEEIRRESGWPKKANSVSGALKRIAPNLRAKGINFTRGEGRERRRIILESSCNSSSPSSP
jgi:hypothetical protein